MVFVLNYVFLTLVPEESPTGLRVTKTTSTSISLSWQPLDLTKWRGERKGYGIAVIKQATESVVVNITIGPDHNNTIIKELIPYTSYTVTVRRAISLVQIRKMFVLFYMSVMLFLLFW